MESMLIEYCNYINIFYSTAISLHLELERFIEIVPDTNNDPESYPHKKSFMEQLRNWPSQLPQTPPSAWVIPRKGFIDFNGNRWSYNFHGQGITFINTHNGQDISVEYTLHGEIGITKYNFESFLETYCNENSITKLLIEKHDDLFDMCIEMNFLQEVPVRMFSDEQTFIPV